MRYLMLLLLLALTATPAAAQGQAPNRQDIVDRVIAAEPAKFACAHIESCGDAKYDWVKAVAWALSQADPRFGLNMKRDNDSQGLSMDAITFRRGPTDRDVEVYDICGGCGAPGARGAWQDVTDYSRFGQPGHARYVKPSPVGGTSGGSGTGGANAGGAGSLPPTTNLQPVLDALAALTAKVDAIAALALAARDAALDGKSQAEQAKINASDVRHIAMPELKALLEKSGVTGCLKGKVPKAFGGSTEVVFCPAVP